MYDDTAAALSCSDCCQYNQVQRFTCANSWDRVIVSLYGSNYLLVVEDTTTAILTSVGQMHAL